MPSGRVEIDILKRGDYPIPRLLDENDFDDEMARKVIPYINERKRSGMFGSDNELYYELYPCPGSRGTVVICHGYMESCVKYYEFIYYLLQCGFQAAVYDQRGHGRSVREGSDPDIVHITSFDDYVDDLHVFVTEVVMPSLGAGREKLYLFGHSLGGCVGARYIELHPGYFTKVILNSPMFAVNFGSVPPAAVLLLSQLMIIARQGNHRLFGQRAFDRRPNPVLSAGRSEARYMYYHQIRLKDKKYQISGCDYYWVREITKAGFKARLKYEVRKIRSDVMVIMGGQDDIADREAQEAFVSKLKYGKAVLMPESKHETFGDRNSVLEDFYSLVFSWFDPSVREM